MTKLHSKHARRKKRSTSGKLTTNLKERIVQTGPPKLFAFATLAALGLGALIQFQYLSPQHAANEALAETLAQKRRQNTIARMVQETKPQFLDQFRRLIQNYRTARELLPSEAEVSNVLDAIQQMARSNQVRVTMFDASKPGAKSTTSTPPPQITQASATQPAQPSQPASPQITLNERVMPAQIQGTHANVARFMSAVAQYPRIIYVRDFSITSLNRQESVNLTLVTYDAPTSGILPPIPTELRQELQNQTAQIANR